MAMQTAIRPLNIFRGTLRVSLSPLQTTVADIDAFIRSLKDTREHY